MVKTTPLYPLLESSGAILAENEGWWIANHFGEPKAEMETLRNSIGLMDFSSNVKIYVEGKPAAAAIESAYDIDAAGLAISTGHNTGTFSVFRLRNDQYFIHGPPGSEERHLAALRPAAENAGAHTTITDMTDGKSEIGLVGPHAATLLSRLCGLDFTETQFPNLAARQSSVAKTPQLIFRQDLQRIPAFALIGDRSLAIYLWRTALEAGRDLGATPAGLEALHKFL